MNSIAVWVLVFVAGAGNGGGPLVIENIASVQECERVRAVLAESFRVTSRCIEVRKTR